jgi:membrane-bound lytic murein transglycosylase B
MLVLGACGDSSNPTTAASSTSATAPTTTTVATTATTAAVEVDTGGLPERPPAAPTSPESAAAALEAAERTIRDPDADPAELTTMAVVQQVTYRTLGLHPEWDDAVFARLPPDLHVDVRRNVVARRELRAMHTRLRDELPAWRIVEPPPADALVAHYREAEAQFGIPWTYLAAINLVETGMGRIRGTSVAGAQGPMQFLPATWNAFGEGDINDPRDAILAAARYLAHNNGANDIAGALWNYNHSDRYVRAVSAYAEIMRDTPRTFYGYYHWGIFYATNGGDVWLPVGYGS